MSTENIIFPSKYKPACLHQVLVTTQLSQVVLWKCVMFCKIYHTSGHRLRSDTGPTEAQKINFKKLQNPSEKVNSAIYQMIPKERIFVDSSSKAPEGGGPWSKTRPPLSRSKNDKTKALEPKPGRKVALQKPPVWPR